MCLISLQDLGLEAFESEPPGSSSSGGVKLYALCLLLKNTRTEELKSE